MGSGSMERLGQLGPQPPIWPKRPPPDGPVWAQGLLALPPQNGRIHRASYSSPQRIPVWVPTPVQGAHNVFLLIAL